MQRLRKAIASARSDRFTLALVLVLVVAAVLRVVWVVFAAREPEGLHDPTWYAIGATRIADGEGYTLIGGDPTAYYPIGYPAALSVVAWLGANTPVTDDLPLAAGLAQVLVALVTVTLIALVGRRLVSPRVGLIAAGLVAVFPSQIFYTATLLSETLFNLLLLASLAVLVWPRPQPPSWPRVGAAGVILGLAVLTRPVALAVVPLVACVWGVSAVGWRAAGRRTVILIIGVLVVVAPWTVRNTVRMGELVVISTNTGDNLCIGHNPEATGAFDLFDFCLEDVEGRFSLEDELDRDRTLTRRALRYVAENPHREIPLLWWRAYHTFSTDDDGLTAVESYGDDPFLSDRQRDVLATIANGFYFGLLALAAFGVVALWRRRDARRLVYLAFMAAMFVAPLPFFGDPRFKVPFTLLAVIPAATAIDALMRSTRGEPTQRESRPRAVSFPEPSSLQAQASDDETR